MYGTGWTDLMQLWQWKVCYSWSRNFTCLATEPSTVLLSFIPKHNDATSQAVCSGCKWWRQANLRLFEQQGRWLAPER